MAFKLVHFFVLLCYINILAYEVGGNSYVENRTSILNGESILEFVLDDVLDLPISKSASDVEILYEEYRTTQQQAYLLPAILVVLFSFGLAIAPIVERIKHPLYTGKKRQIIPGYYAFLYRYKPF